MKINEFIEMYEKNPRINLEEKLEVNKYIGIMHKQKIATLVLDNCTSMIDGEIHINSIDKYILFIIAVIGAHTNLEFVCEENENYGSIDGYDALCESGLLVKVIDTFKDDYVACQEVLNMMTSDRLQNHITFEKKIYQFLDYIQEILENGINNLTEKLNFDNFDQEKIMQLYDLIGNQKIND